MSEPITIILLTYERTEYALKTIDSVLANLRYPNLAWFVADDGSSSEHISAITTRLQGHNIVGMWSQRDSYGRSANEGIAATRTQGQLAFFLEDDWELKEPFDLWPYAALLMEDETVGMIRMGYLNEGVTGTTFGHRGQLYWKLSDISPYIFAGHPSLRHLRFHDHAGGYIEHLQPGETELAMAWKHKSSQDPKPSIVWPTLLGQYGPFNHIGTQQSYVWNGGHPLE